jgi:hypothetical protein
MGNAASSSNSKSYGTGATNKHELAKQVALCTVGPLNRAGTEVAKSCMDAAMRDYNPSITLPSRIGVSAGDNMNNSYPSSNNNHDSYYHACSHSSNYTRGCPAYDPYHTPSNGAVKYDDTAKIVYQYGSYVINGKGHTTTKWGPSADLSAGRYGYPNGVNQSKPQQQRRFNR